MHKLIVLAAVAGALALPAEGVPTVMQDAQVEGEGEGEGQHVLAVEDEWISAEINRDEATLRRVIDDRFVFNSNNGRTSGKADLIKNVLGWRMTGQTVSERTVLVDGDTAVVFGTTELRSASETQADGRTLLRYTATYVKRGGKWRALALQMAKGESAR
jgi:ketosteroid isomerase-like protein